MRVETAPVEWLRTVVEAVCATLGTNPAMLPTDPHLAAEKVVEVITFAVEGVDGDGYETGAYPGTLRNPHPPQPPQPTRAALKELAATLHTMLSDIHQLSSIADDTADAVSDAIAHIEESTKEKT